MHSEVGIATTKGREAVLQETIKSLRNETKLNIFCDLKKGMFFNHRASWNELFKNSEIALLLQDDISATKNWYKTCLLFADKFPKQQIFSFYNLFGKKPPKELNGVFLLENGLWEQAIMIRKPLHDLLKKTLTKDMIKYRRMPKNKRRDYHHDSIVKDVLNKIKYRQMKVFPPFFQHRDENSTLGNNRTFQGKPRQSIFYLGDDVDSFDYFSKRLEYI